MRAKAHPAKKTSASSRKGEYVFDNAGPEAQARFAALPLIFDPGTIRHLEARGVAPGWKCLEVGAGGGSIAKWLVERVAPSGHVLATDIDTRFLETFRATNLEVREHNIVSDTLPEKTFDLAHARLVLSHIPEREQVLRRMISALRPGGWIVVEDVDVFATWPDPGLDSGETLLKTFAAMFTVMTQRGNDLRFGRKVPSRLRAAGLSDVDAEGRTFMWNGKSVGAALMRANFEQLHDAMGAANLITEQQFAADLKRLEDPNFVMPSLLLWAAWGRVPAR